MTLLLKRRDSMKLFLLNTAALVYALNSGCTGIPSDQNATTTTTTLTNEEYLSYITEIANPDGRIDEYNLSQAIELASNQLFEAYVESSILSAPTWVPGMDKPLPNPPTGPKAEYMKELESAIPALQKRIQAYSRFLLEMQYNATDTSINCINQIYNNANDEIRKNDLNKAQMTVEALFGLFPPTSVLLALRDSRNLAIDIKEEGMTAGTILSAGLIAVGAFGDIGEIIRVSGAIKIGSKYFLKNGDQVVEILKQEGKVTSRVSTLDELATVLVSENVTNKPKILEFGIGPGFSSNVPLKSYLDDFVKKNDVVTVGVEKCAKFKTKEGGEIYVLYHDFKNGQLNSLFNNIPGETAFAVNTQVEDIVSISRNYKWLKFHNPWEPTGHLISYNVQSMKAVLDNGTSIYKCATLNTVLGAIKSDVCFDMKKAVYDLIYNNDSLNRVITEQMVNTGAQAHVNGNILTALKPADEMSNEELTKFFQKYTCLEHNSNPPIFNKLLKMELLNGGLENIYRKLYEGYTVNFVMVPPEIYRQLSPHSFQISNSFDTYYMAEVLAK